jgi:hypothetical protein
LWTHWPMLAWRDSGAPLTANRPARKISPIISNVIECLNDQHFQWVFIHLIGGLYALLNLNICWCAVILYKYFTMII